MDITRRGAGGSRRRRMFGALGAGVAACSAFAFAAVGANADVTPTGAITVTVAGSTLVTVLGTGGTATFTGTLTGTVDAAGNLSFPKAGATFPVTGDETIGAATFDLQPSLASDWTGTINTSTGAISVTGDLYIATIGKKPVAFASCAIGPISVHLTTSSTGSGSAGAPYNATTGKATIAQAGFTTPKLPIAAPFNPGCDQNASNTINLALGLPNTLGKVQLALTFSPKLSTATTTTTTGPSTTTSTTIAPTTSTTSSSSTSTSTTSSTATSSTTTSSTTTSTTSTTIKPTTTTTASTSTTTTTSKPTTTTTASTSTTSTTAAPVTHQGGSTTTTTAAPATTSSTVSGLENSSAATTTTVASGSGGTLPRTGSPTMPLVALGLTFVGVGVGLLRRRSAHT